jgi:hypothetical protein
MRQRSPSGFTSTSATRCTGAPWSAPWPGRKKNAEAGAAPPLPGPDGQSLAAHYEALRPAGVTLDTPAPRSQPSLRGRALLMRHGMVAWMQSVAEGGARAAIPRPARIAAALPAGVHRPVIDILATMVLASTRESPT